MAPQLCLVHSWEEGAAPLLEGQGPDRNTYREEAGVEVQEGHEHQDQQDPASELHVLSGGALAHGGDAREHALPFGTGLRQEKQQASSQGQVPEERTRHASRSGSSGSVSARRTTSGDPGRSRDSGDTHGQGSPTRPETRMPPRHPRDGLAWALLLTSWVPGSQYFTWALVALMRYGVGRDDLILTSVLGAVGGEGKGFTNVRYRF